MCHVRLSSEEFILQKGQCFYFLFSLLSINLIFDNNTSSSYSVFCTFDILLCLKYLAEPVYSDFYTLFAHWSNVFSCNKYTVGLSKEEYYIRLIDGTPVKSYTPYFSPAVIEAIESELEKLEKADLLSLLTVLVLFLLSV